MPLILSVGGIFLALRYSRECYNGIESGIGFCLNVLIPSLFFFMIVAAFIVGSGIADTLCRPLGGLSHILFRLPPESLAVILLSMIGGYPVGAACAEILYRDGRLSPSQAAKTVYIAVAAGPGFLINYIGVSLLDLPQAGYVLLAAQVIALVLTGVIIGHTVKSEPIPHAVAKVQPKGNLLVNAVQSASRSAFHMCAMVVVFSALIEVTDAVVSDPVVCDIASAIIEITNGCNRIAGNYPLWLTAFFVGFGGLSVHFQIFTSLKNVAIKKYLFFLFRIIQGIFAGIFTYILVSIFPETQAVFSTAEVQSAGISGTVWGSAALILSSMVFLGSISQGGKYVLNRGYYNNRL